MGRGAGTIWATLKGGAEGAGVMRGGGDGLVEERGLEVLDGGEKISARAWSWADSVKARDGRVEPGEGLRRAWRISGKPVLMMVRSSAIGMGMECGNQARVGDAFGLGGPYPGAIAPVVFKGRADIPAVDSMRSPGLTTIGLFMDDDMDAGGGQWV